MDSSLAFDPAAGLAYATFDVDNRDLTPPTLTNKVVTIDVSGGTIVSNHSRAEGPSSPIAFDPATHALVQVAELEPPNRPTGEQLDLRLLDPATGVPTGPSDLNIFNDDREGTDTEGTWLAFDAVNREAFVSYDVSLPFPEPGESHLVRIAVGMDSTDQHQLLGDFLVAEGGPLAYDPVTGTLLQAQIDFNATMVSLRSIDPGTGAPDARLDTMICCGPNLLVGDAWMAYDPGTREAYTVVEALDGSGSSSTRLITVDTITGAIISDVSTPFGGAIAIVPEPSTALLLGAGLAGLAMRRRGRS